MINLCDKYIGVGIYLEFFDSLSDALMEAIDIGLYVMCFSLGRSRSMTRKRIENTDLNICMGLSTRFPMILFSQIPDMYNLAGSRKCLAWNGNEVQDNLTVNIIKEIEYELYTLARLGGSVIAELGSYLDQRRGMLAVVKTINHLRFKLGYRLILINSLDEYNKLGKTMGDLHQVYTSIDKSSKKHVGIGFNLAYLFANGVYDFTQPDEIRRLFSDYKTSFGKRVPISVIFLYDTTEPFNSKRFSAAPLGNGLLWNDETLSVLLQICTQKNIPVVTSHENELCLEYTRGLSSNF